MKQVGLMCVKEEISIVKSQSLKCKSSTCIFVKKKTKQKKNTENRGEYKSEGEESIEFPILSLLNTVQFIKGVFCMGNSADHLFLGVGIKFVFCLRLSTDMKPSLSLSPIPSFLYSKQSITSTVAIYGILWQNLTGKS